MMNVSEITTDDLIVIARSGHSASFEMIAALAQAELDRRGKVEEPAGKSDLQWAEEERAEAVKRYERAESQCDKALECLQVYKDALALEGGELVNGFIRWKPRFNVTPQGMSAIVTEAAKPAEKAEAVKSCKTCGNGPPLSDKCRLKSCKGCSGGQNFNNWIPKASEKVEVVKYWRIKANGPERLLKSIGGYLVEVVDELQGVKDVKGEMEPLLDGHQEITAAEYEAAKQPKPTERPEIEPEPWLCLPNEILVRNEVAAMFQQLQRRLEAVERRGK